MVRRGVIFSLLEASCWRVDVIKGGAGLFCFSARFRLLTVKGAEDTAAITASVSSLQEYTVAVSDLEGQARKNLTVSITVAK